MGNINNPNYTHYVVAGGKIQSGWEYKEDAADAKAELPSKAGAKVVAKSALNSRHGIDANNDQHWHDNDSFRKLLHEAVNNSDYTHYVVAGGKIESGWEYKEDATEQVKENLHPKVAAAAKVVAKSALSRHGIDPENDSHWHDQASMKKLTESLGSSPIRALTEGNLYEFGRGLKKELTERAMHIMNGVDMKRLLEFARRRELLEFNYDHPDYSHFVIGRGKIISGHSSPEAAGFRHSRMPLKIQRDAKVISRDKLKKPFFDPSNNDHWAKPEDLKEAYGEDILSESTIGDYIKRAAGDTQQATHYVVQKRGERSLISAASVGPEHAKSLADRLNKDSNVSKSKLSPRGTYHVVAASDLHKHGLSPENEKHWEGWHMLNEGAESHFLVVPNVYGEHKIWSSHESEEEANSIKAHLNASPRMVDPAYVVARGEMGKHGLNPNDMSQWHGNTANRMHEQEDQPDNAVDPLSREAVKALFKDYKRNVAPSQNNDDVEAHSEDGKTRAGDHSKADDPEPAKHTPGA